mgnify:FL=1|jgi:hypothetical protein|tara:strand:+ start:774 stop:1004 length:231 start_codon:yes stop_codon:yes gene_type:complete
MGKKERPIILNKDYLTRAEAQIYLGLSESAFDKLVKRYCIPAAKPPGCKVMFRRSDLSQLTELFFDQPVINLGLSV